MQFRDLSPKLQVCLLGGLLAAVESELHKHKSKLANTVNTMARNVGIEENDINDLMDGLTQAEQEEMVKFAAFRNAQQ